MIPVLDKITGINGVVDINEIVPGLAVKAIPLETEATLLPAIVDMETEKLEVGLL